VIKTPDPGHARRRSISRSGDYVLPTLLSLFAPLTSALAANCLAVCDPSLFALGHEKPLSLDRTQNAILSNSFAKALEQALRRFSIADYDPGHP
jgi:hypothetical protein